MLLFTEGPVAPMGPTNNILPFIIGIIVALILGGVLVYFIPVFGFKKTQKKTQELIDETNKKAEDILNKALNEGRQEVRELRQNAELEIKEKKQEVANLQNKLSMREDNLDRRDVALQNKEAALDQRNESLNKRHSDLDKKENEINKKNDTIEAELQRIAQLTNQEAKDIIMKQVEERSANEVAAYLRGKEEEAKNKASETARNILALSIEKYSQEVANDRTVCVVSLPNDDLKGRIIGREGRNIRTIEQLTGCDLIIDDTPEVITISCFNPIRRQIAKKALEYLISDGRIQPGKIEELVEKATNELNEEMHKAGEDVLFELGITNMPNEIVDILGRLKFRTSYGQNGLQHSKEVAFLCGIMAAELGANQQIAKRAGLLHDLGKAMDFEMDGSHVEIGVRLAKKYGESFEVINAIEAHHGDVEPATLYANLVIAADTLSAARPGARSETLENYVQRIEKLETISKEFDGVQSAFAIQAGREIRVMVVPEKVDDNASYTLARKIREKIESDMTYPGQIKVTVIREVRASETAK